MRISLPVRAFILAVGLIGAPLGADAQVPSKTARIVVLDVGSPADSSGRIEALRTGLRQLGHVEGRNITVEWRFAEGQSARLSGLASELASPCEAGCSRVPQRRGGPCPT